MPEKVAASRKTRMTAGETLDTAARKVAEAVRQPRPPRKKGVREAEPVVNKNDLWENDPSLITKTPEAQRRIDQMAESFMLSRLPDAPKVEKPSTPLERWQAAAAKAAQTGKMANTLAKALAKRSSKRWQFVDFLGPNGRESAGIVDIVAIRKSSTKLTHSVLKPLDLFDIILIQVKGGSAPEPTNPDILRLKAVKDIYNAKGIVLFQWRKGLASGFYLLNEDTHKWEQKTAVKLFG